MNNFRSTSKRGSSPAAASLSNAVGKTVYTRTYLHVIALENADTEFQALISRAIAIANVGPNEFNVVRCDMINQIVGLLHYADFFEAGFPSLLRSWKVQLLDQRVTFRTYADSLNPPVLHRKELLLSPDDPRQSQYTRLTAALESLGMFDDPVRIGFRIQWTKLLAEKGYRVVGNDLIPIGNDESLAANEIQIDGGIEVARHLTALTRHGFSAPIQLLCHFGLLDWTARLFDYGCGKGDDLRGLVANGINAAGWDPYYAPESSITEADIVNLGFVINVIEPSSAAASCAR